VQSDSAGPSAPVAPQVVKVKEQAFAGTLALHVVSQAFQVPLAVWPQTFAADVQPGLALHATFPLPGATVPPPQARHAATLVPPVVAEYVPQGHGMQAAVSTGAYVPAGQSVQVAAPGEDDVPAGHAVQAPESDCE